MPNHSRRLLLLPALALLACGGPPPAPAPAATFTDAEGNAVMLPVLPARRLVSTMQSATEWVILLGATDRLVSRTDYDRQPELAHLPSIGGGLDPSPEAVAALKPDAVLGWKNRSSSDLQRALAPFHIPVLSLETADTADLFRHLASLGELVGKRTVADSLAADLRGQLRATRDAACAATDSTARASVLVVLWTDPAMTSGAGTWLDTVMETACLRNVFADLSAPWPTVAMEAIVSRDPDWVLTSIGAPGQRLGELRQLAGWKNLRAVREGRVLEIPGDLLSRAGPSIADAARAIVAARAAHVPVTR